MERGGCGGCGLSVLLGGVTLLTAVWFAFLR